MVCQVETTFADLSHGEFILKVEGIVDALAVHPVFEPWPDFVPSPEEIRAQLVTFRKTLGVPGQDEEHSNAEIAAVRTAIVQSFTFTGQFAVMKSLKAGDLEILHKAGFTVKTRPAYKKTRKEVTDAPTGVVIKHGPQSGTVIITTDKVEGAGGYVVDVTKVPTDESSWKEVGMYDSCYRMKVQGLEEATKCYFRVRAIGPNGPGPWSQVVSLVIL